jgi:GDPmannose 4,6-dehydratase
MGRPTALIVGSAGQDGRLLTELLVARGYRVVGLSRTTLTDSDGAETGSADLLRAESIQELVASVDPGEIYYLAAVHGSAEQETQVEASALWQQSFDIHVRGLVNCLEAIAKLSPSIRLIYAGSSHVFGRTDRRRQTERTPFAPDSVYAITKAAGIYACRAFRHRRSLFAAAAVLYNHESHLRQPQFVSRKIVTAALEISRGERSLLELLDVNACVDWGFARDYVEAMTRIISLGFPDDFIVATGRSHTVSEFARIAFDAVGLDWSRYVRSNGADKSRVQRVWLVGNPTKLRRATGWRPTVTFEEMVRTLVAAEQTGSVRA